MSQPTPLQIQRCIRSETELTMSDFTLYPVVIKDESPKAIFVDPTSGPPETKKLRRQKVGEYWEWVIGCIDSWGDC